MKRRLLPLLMALALVLSACAGGGGETPAEKPEGPAENTQSAEAPASADTAGSAESPETADEAAPEPLDDEYRNWYEIFVWSFFDTDNDGIGDLGGVTEKLDYINDLGFNGIWLMPITAGTSYHKYDVEDYCAVDPQFGTLEDYDALLAAAHERGIRVIIDLVVNHTSSEHPWFTDACAYLRQHGEPGGDHGDYYNFSREEKQGYHPVSGTDWYYEGQFTPTMPDLNLDSDRVKGEIEAILRFWLDRGTDGFRLDACTSLYTNSTPKSIDFLSWLNETSERIKPGSYLVGEAWYPNHAAVREYYESGVDSFFLFPLAMADGEVASCLKDIRSAPGKNFSELLTTLDETYDTGIPAPFLSNHDTARIASFLGRSQEDKIKMAQGLLSLLRGSPFVYYGEEIGMISTSDGSDPYKRIAMKWEEKRVYEGWCYTAPQDIKVTEENYVYPSAAAQAEDPASILSYYRHSLRMRNAHPAIARGGTEILWDVTGETGYVSAFTRTWQGESVTLAVNLDREYGHEVTLGTGFTLEDSLLASGGEAAYDPDTGKLTLPPYSIALLTPTE